jgi:hypothetical protein
VSLQSNFGCHKFTLSSIFILTRRTLLRKGLQRYEFVQLKQKDLG